MTSIWWFIAVQNLVGIDAVVSIICKIVDILQVWLENAHSLPKWTFWGGILLPKWGAVTL